MFMKCLALKLSLWKGLSIKCPNAGFKGIFLDIERIFLDIKGICLDIEGIFLHIERVFLDIEVKWREVCLDIVTISGHIRDISRHGRTVSGQSRNMYLFLFLCPVCTVCIILENILNRIEIEGLKIESALN